MKLTCDLCGGALQMKPGGQSAVCTECGLTYSMERLREKLGQMNAPASAAAQPPQKQPKTPAETAAEKVSEALPEPPADTPLPTEPSEFRMRIEDIFVITGRGTVVTGTIESGSVSVGGTVWINGDKTGRVEGIEWYRTLIDEATQGQSVGILLNGIKRKDVAKGDLLTAPAEPRQPEPDDAVYDVTEWIPLEEDAASAEVFVPQQFVMECTGVKGEEICGEIVQGGIGLGDTVYINADETMRHAYRVCRIGGKPGISCAKAGQKTTITLVRCPKRMLSKTRTLASVGDPVPSAYNFPGTPREYFEQLLRREFPQYPVRTEVCLKELKIPVTFLLYSGSKPVLAVFLINSHSSCTQVRRAAKLFEPVGIACTHFYEDYRNDTPYVVNRVRDALGEKPN